MQHTNRTPLDGDDLAFARSFIDGARWQYASSVKDAPHEYSVDVWSDEADFQRFARLIAAHGVREVWTDGYAYRYLTIGPRRYWISPAVFSAGWCANRARLEDLPEPAQLRLEVDR
jgi:hypothetical protein